VLIVLAGGACAQELTSEADCSKLNALLPQIRGARLEAYVDAIRPQLSYAFRFQAAYSVAVPLRQYTGNRIAIRVLARVTPANRSRPPVCFVQDASLGPEVPPRMHHDFVFSGGFFLGEGKYEVNLTLVDQQARLYRKRLTLSAIRSRREQRLELRLAPGVVQPMQKLDWTPRASPLHGARRRLTVFFNVASLYGHRTFLWVSDQMLLLSSLSTVLSGCGFDEIRLIAFNLDQQREVFRQDPFDMNGFRRLVETVAALKLYAVSSGALKPETQQFGMLDSLVRAEYAVSPPPDAILFLGPHVEDDLKWKEIPCESGRSHPRLFYFEHRIDTAPLGWGTDPVSVGNVSAGGLKVEVPVRPAEFPDTLERVVRACSGEVVRIHNAAELAGAIAKLNEP
jgi:hypothetical protein